MRVLVSFRTFLVICLALVSAISMAIFPPEVSDRDLSQSPVIVIGYWPKAKVKWRGNVKGNVCYDVESTTKLKITKVIRGRLSTGTHTLMLKDWISWDKDGSMLNSASSSEMIGDVDDVSKPNIWFLTVSRSWNKSDKTEYFHAYSYRCVQPRTLLGFYQTLANPDRESAIASYLLSSNPLVVERSLNFVSDGQSAWPDYPDTDRDEYQFARNHYDRRKLRRITQQLPTLLQMVQNPKHRCRPKAVALYAEMTGTSSKPELQKALQDQDPNVRSTAAAWLIRFGAIDDYGNLRRALRGFTDYELGIELIFAMQKSGLMEYVPILIDYLQPILTPQPDHRDWIGLAQQSRKSLKVMTDYTFPLDSALASRAWNQAKAQPKAQMLDTLRQELGDWENPIEITATFKKKLDRKKKKDVFDFEAYLVHLKVKNLTNHPIKIASAPDGFELSSGFGGASGGVVARRRTIITIGPNAAVEVEVEMFRAEKGASAKFSYRNATDGAWIGEVSTIMQ